MYNITVGWADFDHFLYIKVRSRSGVPLKKLDIRRNICVYFSELLIRKYLSNSLHEVQKLVFIM
jgi:hypothetical protein